MLPGAVKNGDGGNLTALKFLFEKVVEVEVDDTSHIAFTSFDQISNRLQRRSFTGWCLTFSIELGSEVFEKHLRAIDRRARAFFRDRFLASRSTIRASTSGL